MTGQFVGTIDFDPSSNNVALTSVGSSDYFIAKYTTPITFGLNDLENIHLKMYPNPTTGMLYISSDVLGTNVTAEIYSLQGQLVAQENNVQQQFKLPDNLASGTYILNVKTDNLQSAQIIQLIRD